MTKDELDNLWSHCLSIIKDNVSDTAYNTWFASITPDTFENKVLTISVPSQFVYEYLEEHYVDLLRATIYRIMGKGTQLMYRVLTDKTNQLTVDQESINHKYSTTKGNVMSEAAAPNQLVPHVQDLDPMLKFNYTFDNFIEGISNKLPRTAAESIALNPAKTIFNPLFLYGASGVGKTHLANAIGIKVKELYPDKRVLYVSAHLFKVQYTDSVRKNTVNDFINFYQTIDVLIIDDIQEFVGIEKTQNTFFHIFNHLHQNGKQLIMTCDRPPIMLQGFEERLITRFKWGLTAEIEKPNLALRKDILLSKIHQDGISIKEEVVDYIAGNVTDSVRELEGILISLMAHSTIYNREIDLPMAERIISKAVKVNQKKITIEDIVATVCNHFHLTDEDLFSSSRKREVVMARQIAMFLSQKMVANTSLAKIGQHIGSKDHSTVLHACKTIKDQLEVDKNLQSTVESIEADIRTR